MHAEKQRLRTQLRRLRHDGVRWPWEAVAALDVWRQAHCVLGFYPLPSEPDIRPLLSQALKEGKCLLLPVTDAENRIHPCRVTELDALRPGRYGIPEPDPAQEASQEPDLILVPALAYDLRCRRLGHGAGCYDRYLSGRAAVRLGVCFDDCLLAQVPCEAHDLCVDLVVTEKRLVQRTEDPIYG